ncbi:hypothetical protein ACO0R3_004073 [Hanseniaspora guilliermondii]
MKFTYKDFKKYFINHYKPFNGKVLIIGHNDKSKSHVLLKLCLLIKIVSKKNYSSFKNMTKKQIKKDNKQRRSIIQDNPSETDHLNHFKILSKTIDRENYHESSNFNVETVIYKNKKINIWDVSTNNSKTEEMKWKIWKNNLLGTKVLIYCIDINLPDKELQKSKENLLKIMQDEDMKHSFLAIMLTTNNQPSETSISKERIQTLKQFFLNVGIKQPTNIFVCSTDKIYNENDETMDFLNKNCNNVADYSTIDKKFFKDCCKKDSMIDMMNWMVEELEV